MNKKETLEFLINGFKEQFEELGKEIGVDGHSAEVADVRLDTGAALLSLIEKREEIEKDNEALKATGIKVDTSKIIDRYIDGRKISTIGKVDLSNIPTDDLIDELIKRAEDDGAVG